MGRNFIKTLDRSRDLARSVWSSCRRRLTVSVTVAALHFIGHGWLLIYSLLHDPSAAPGYGTACAGDLLALLWALR
jgi:hypothetical protein